MKTKFCILFFVFLAFSGFSQSFRAGLNLGVCTTQIDGDEAHGWDKAGFLGGIAVCYPISEKLKFQTEIKYFQKGSRVIVNGLAEYERFLHYIEMPYYFRLALPVTINKKKINLEGELGVAIAYLAKSKVLYMGYESKSANNFNRFDYSAIFGVNYIINDRFYTSFKTHYSFISIGEGRTNSRRLIFKTGQYNYVLSFSLYCFI